MLLVVNFAVPHYSIKHSQLADLVFGFTVSNFWLILAAVDGVVSSYSLLLFSEIKKPLSYSLFSQTNVR